MSILPTTPPSKAEIRIFGPNRAVFLDRDGVINRSLVVGGKPFAPRTLSAFRLLPGVPRAVARLKAANLHTIVVTNQPDIGNGLVDPMVVAAMNAKVREKVGVDDIKMCPHAQNAGCDCRKPGIALLVEAARERRLDLSQCYFVGDRSSDIVSGARAGCYTVFVDRGYAESGRERPDARVPNLPRAADLILQHMGQSKT